MTGGVFSGHGFIFNRFINYGYRTRIDKIQLACFIFILLNLTLLSLQAKIKYLHKFKHFQFTPF